MSSSNRPIDLKAIDDKIVLLVNGFTHNVGKLMENTIIPEPIFLMILSFYYVCEFFKDTDCILQNDDHKAISTGINLNAYGNVIIDSDSTKNHEWIFKIGYMVDGETCIGIADSSYKKSNGLPATSDKAYAFGDGYTWEAGSLADAPRFEEGNTVTMVFNSANKSLHYKINDDNDSCVRINDIKPLNATGYRMAVFLGEAKDWIELISYKSLENDHC